MADRDAEVTAGVDRAREELVETRRALHRRPELSHAEHWTAEVAAERCRSLGFTVRTGVGGTGVIADLAGSGEGPTVMLRADMDALPVLERGENRPVRSEVDGAMHACGHDGHVAMALGAAAVLAGLRDGWAGTVRMCFQPAEEIAGGAQPMIDEGALDGVDGVLGIHLWAPLQVGHVAVTHGTLFGSADEFGLVIRGRGGHGGMPHTATDPLPATAAVISALQTIVSRETSPFSPAVVTVGDIRGGTAANVIAEEIRLRGTVRAVEQSERERVLRRVGEVAEGVASGFGCTAAFERRNGCPPVISDRGVADIVRAAAAETVGAEQVEEASPITVGDDVALFLNQVPGCYFLVGAGDVARHPVAPHHHPEFDIDERCLPVGTGTMVRAALRLLDGAGAGR